MWLSVEELMCFDRFGQATVLKTEAIRVVSYTPLYAGEGVYATFQFFYRSEGLIELHPIVLL